MPGMRSELLSEIQKVPLVGTPGKIIVFGERAEPLFTGSNDDDVIMAAAEFGKGRIFVFAHVGYADRLANGSLLSKDRPFYDKVVVWVSQCRSAPDVKILNLDETRDPTDRAIDTYDVLVSVGVRESVSCSKVRKYVQSGGGFIYATTPWVWTRLGHSLSSIPYAKMLLEAGIWYSSAVDYPAHNGKHLVVSRNRARFSNISRCLSESSAKLMKRCRILNLLLELPPKYRKHFRSVVERHWKFADDKMREIVPSGVVRINSKTDKNVLDFWCFAAEFLDKRSVKAPGIDEFPGDFDCSPYLTERRLEFSSDGEEVFFTSCYVPAGTCSSVNVTKVDGRWTLVVGAHTDYLPEAPVIRWPKLSLQLEISETGSYVVSSPFGGSVYLRSPGLKGAIVAMVSNIVICPRLDTTRKCRSWEAVRKDPGLWADLSGRFVTITLPSASVRNIEDPSQALDLYDTLIESYHDLRGTNAFDSRKQWIVTDIQVPVGYMHAGYPIVTHLDVADPGNEEFLLDAVSLRSIGSWSIFHEIGHNMQQNEWTFAGTREVTVNIFTLYGMDVICGIDPWYHPWLRNFSGDALEYLKGGANFEKWKSSPGVALFFYAQLVHSFKWETYKRVFRLYRDLESDRKPESDQDKIDMWLRNFSVEADFNLAPVCVFWGIPLSLGTVKAIDEFRPFLPDDEITKQAPDRVVLVKGSYPSLVRNV